MKAACVAALACIALGIGSAAVAADAGQNAPATIGDLVRKGSVPVQKNTPAPGDSAKAMENYKRFLELQRTDPTLRAADRPPTRPGSPRCRARHAAATATSDVEQAVCTVMLGRRRST